MIETPTEPELRGHRARWQIQPRLPDEIRRELGDRSVMAAHLLYCRGFRSLEDIQGFFEAKPVSHDPFLMPDMEAAVSRIALARQQGEKVAVYGDFDCDGITSAAVLQETLTSLGLDPIVHIPERVDGHGLHPETLAMLQGRGVSLVVTADCGITAIEEVIVAKGLGLDVIITDHHEPRPDGSLPDCLVVAPTRLHSEYPFRSLCGAGVVYKLAQALATRLPGALDPSDLLDLVAMGTVADVVPLRDENRSLVISGIERLRETRRPGLRALFRAAEVDPSRIDPISIGYYLAPRINAANRMASPQLAYELLTATDATEADRLAERLSDLNRQRQALVDTMLAMLLEEFGDPLALAEAVVAGERSPILVTLGDWPAGISGLLASKLVDVYGLPAFVATRDGELVIASARGAAGARIDEILEWCEASRPGGLFDGYGGHSRAGGFRVQADRWSETQVILADQAGRIEIDALGAVLEVDAEVSLRQLNFHAGKLIHSLAPFGMEFAEPLFLARNVVLRGKQPTVGDKHVRVRLSQSNAFAGGMFFNAPSEFLELPLDTAMDVLFHVSLNEWKGTLAVETQIRDWRIAE
ncbi:MAG TPA: single-stranded-DNA-specific exonuclease RecJ [Chloroflexi bacterium]|nr:single-stranded-DNA-specific exonuclease RecJ [Chloroflexota bacterium]